MAEERKKEVEIIFNLNFLKNNITIEGGLESPFEARFFVYSVVLGDLTTLADSIREKEGIDSPNYQEIIAAMITVRELASLNKKILAHENGVDLKSDWEEFKSMVTAMNKVIDVYEHIGDRFDWKDFLRSSPEEKIYKEFDVFEEDFTIEDLKVVRDEIKSKIDFFEGHERKIADKITEHTNTPPDMSGVRNLSDEVKSENEQSDKHSEETPRESKKKGNNDNNDSDILL